MMVDGDGETALPVMPLDQEVEVGFVVSPTDLIFLPSTIILYVVPLDICLMLVSDSEKDCRTVFNK
jgi:hypothetical protein